MPGTGGGPESKPVRQNATAAARRWELSCCRRTSDPLSVTDDWAEGTFRVCVAQPSPFLQTGRRGPVRTRRASLDITHLDARAKHNLRQLAQPTAQPKPTLAAAHPRNGCEPRSENSSSQAQRSAPSSQTSQSLSRAVESPGCHMERGMLGRGAAGGRGREGSLGLQPPAGLPSLQGAGAGGAGWSVSHSWLQPAHLQTTVCFLLLSLRGASFRGQPSRALSEQGGPGPSPGRAGPGGRKQQPAPRWVVAQQGFQWRPACAPGEHRKQVGLVDPRPHKGSRHLEGSSMQTREATYLCSLAGAIAHLQPVVRWGSLGCKHHSAAESGERWSSKGWIWVI